VMRQSCLDGISQDHQRVSKHINIHIYTQNDDNHLAVAL